MFDFTTASRQQLNHVWKAIEREMGDDRFFTTKELDHLPKVLHPKEQVLAFSSGLHKGNTWLIVLTNERILFLDKGLVYGLQTSSIEISKVNNFDYKKGLMFGSISIGSNAEIYEITNVWKKTVEPFTKKLREAIKAREQGVILRSPGTESEDIQPEETPKEDPFEGYESGDYEVYTPPSEERGPLAMETLQEPEEGVADSNANSLNPAEERMRRAGL